jgi:hypothetical protein
MVEHANRYLASGGTDGYMYKTSLPGKGEITAPALLLTTGPCAMSVRSSRKIMDELLADRRRN